MAIAYSDESATFSGVVGVADAEGLLEWLQGKKDARIDLAACSHLHPANLQVLIAARAAVSAWPTDPDLAAWLLPALTFR